MNFDTPLLLALGVSVVGILGVLAGVIALSGVVQELAQVSRFNDALREDLLEHVSATEFRIKNWIKEKGFLLDSHLAEQLIAVHSEWLRSRPVGLGELHNLSTRRERSRVTARLAGGIAATLLICGIGGTLLAIHPILQAFRIGIDSNGAVQEASQSASHVQAMVQGLGRAFYPSLAALLWTVAIVITRGFYVQKAMRLARVLDSLAFDYFFLKFSPRPLTDDFTRLSAKLSAVADRMSERDAAFAETAGSLAKSIEQIKLLGPVVQKAGEDASNASSKLAKDTNNVVSAFAKHLAENSPLFTAIGQLKESVGTIDLSVNQLTDVAQNLKVSNRETGEIITNLAIPLKEAIDGAPKVIGVACENGVREIGTASVALSTRAKETNDALIERLGKLLDATTKKIETTKTDISQIAPTIAADLDKRIHASFGGLISEVSRTTNDLNDAANRVTQAAQYPKPTSRPINHFPAEKEPPDRTIGVPPVARRSEPVDVNPDPPKESPILVPKPTPVITVTENPIRDESERPSIALQPNGRTDNTAKRSWRGRIWQILRSPLGNSVTAKP